ncbi:MAG TPA: hypothetical protein PK229_12120 [Rhodocyclaceae bacterium]|nr:hypothetical protein [Rhodocyclaceae bacterium]
MAIDTAAKRKSCIGLALIFARTGVIPDGSNLSAAQRLHTDLLYAGIAAGAPSGVTFLPRLTLMGAGCWFLWMVLR